MNKIWIIIILISLIFGLLNGKGQEMIDSIFNVPEQTLKSLITLGSVLVIYNGLFNIAIKTRIIDKIATIFSGFVERLFGYKKGSYLNNAISTSIIANMLGLGAANTTIAIKVVEEMKRENPSNLNKNLTMYLLINISSFVALPLSLLGLRESYNANVNVIFIPILFFISLLTTIFAIILCKVVYK